MLSLGLAVTSSLTSIDGLVRGPYSEGGLFPRLALDFDDNKYATDVGSVTFADAFTAGSPKLTYSTTSNSTMVNSSGNLVWAPHNLVTYSEDFSQWTASSGTTVTAGATSPTGQTDAYQITLAGNNDNVQLTTAGLSTSTAVQYSVYLRVSSGTQSVNLGNIDAGQYQSVTVTTEWQRFVITQTPSATTRFPRILNGTNDSFTVEAFGAHLFRSNLGGMGQVPGAATGFEYYVPTNGAAKYLPRVGHHVYSGSAWVNEGLLIESEERTNLITDSIPDSNWSPIRATISENVSGTVAPDGSQTASKGVESSASGTHRVDFVATLTDTNTYTYSIFAKAAERSMIAMEIGNSSVTGNFARFDLSSGSVAAESGTVTSSIENFGNGWYRCRVTAAAGTTDRILIGIFDGASQSYAGDGSSGVFLWGAQLEENPTASSHIPTSGATVTRAAQTLAVPANWYDVDNPTYTGPELVTNGGFTTDTDWTKGTGWTINTTTGKAVHTQASGAGRLTQRYNGFEIGKVYRLTVTVDTTGDASLSNTAVSFRNTANTSDLANRSSTVGEIVAGGINNVELVWVASATSALVHFYSNDEVTIDNVSVRKVSAPQFGWPEPEYIGSELITNGLNWTGATENTPPTGWTKAGSLTQYTITTGGELEIDRNNESGANTTQTITTEVGKLYQLSLDYIATSSNNQTLLVQVIGGATLVSETVNTLTTHSFEFVADSTSTLIGIRPSSSTSQVVKIDNVSVREINLLSVSIQMDGRMTYADEGLSEQLVFARWQASGGVSYIRSGLTTAGGTTGRVDFRQYLGEEDSVLSGGTIYSPGTLVPFNIASRHGSTFINGAVDGTALTANTTPTALPDLSGTNLQVAHDFMGTIRTFRQFAGDIGDAGLVTATS